MEEEPRDAPALAPAHTRMRSTSAVVAAVAVTLAQEFPHVPVGVLIAATIRSLRGLQRVPLTTLVDAPFNDVLELVTEQTRRAVLRRDDPEAESTRRQNSTFRSRGTGAEGVSAGTSLGAPQGVPVQPRSVRCS